MHYQPIPLIYAANEGFKNTIRFAVEFHDTVDPEALRFAVARARKRYPYFAVNVQKKGEAFRLARNREPFVIADDGKPLCLNSAASNGHLMAFARKNRTIWVDVSHFICDGNGLIPLIKTLVYYYEARRYGADGIDTADIRLVTDKIEEGEYRYPFPASPLPEAQAEAPKPESNHPLLFDDGLFDDGGNYAYNLQIPQNEMMGFAKRVGASPTSLLCVMLFKALTELYPKTEKDIVFQIPHQYRGVLNCPLSHDCLARVFRVILAANDKDQSIYALGESARAQIRAGSAESGDIQSINGLLKLSAYMDTLPLEGKKQAMIGIVAKSLAKHSVGVSYPGDIGWGGMEQHIRNIHIYAGENRRHDALGVEMLTLGEVFSLSLMQPGKNPVFARTLIDTLARYGISGRLMSEERYHLADYQIP